MTIYNIKINEEQRAILERLFNSTTTSFSTEPGTGWGAYDTEAEEFEALKEMLADLPKVEKESPGIVHGLCL